MQTNVLTQRAKILSCLSRGHPLSLGSIFAFLLPVVGFGELHLHTALHVLSLLGIFHPKAV
jgi:hypothetical protein